MSVSARGGDSARGRRPNRNVSMSTQLPPRCAKHTCICIDIDTLPGDCVVSSRWIPELTRFEFQITLLVLSKPLSLPKVTLEHQVSPWIFLKHICVDRYIWAEPTTEYICSSPHCQAHHRLCTAWTGYMYAPYANRAPSTALLDTGTSYRSISITLRQGRIYPLYIKDVMNLTILRVIRSQY